MIQKSMLNKLSTVTVSEIVEPFEYLSEKIADAPFIELFRHFFTSFYLPYLLPEPQQHPTTLKYSAASSSLPRVRLVRHKQQQYSNIKLIFTSQVVEEVVVLVEVEHD